MTTEIETLRDEILRLGVGAHAHGIGEQASCGSGEMCISESDQVTARIVHRDGTQTVYVDPMTAYGVLMGMDADAGEEGVWAELVDIDHGE